MKRWLFTHMHKAITIFGFWCSLFIISYSYYHIANTLRASFGLDAIICFTLSLSLSILCHLIVYKLTQCEHNTFPNQIHNEIAIHFAHSQSKRNKRTCEYFRYLLMQKWLREARPSNCQAKMKSERLCKSWYKVHQAFNILTYFRKLCRRRGCCLRVGKQPFEQIRCETGHIKLIGKNCHRQGVTERERETSKRSDIWTKKNLKMETDSLRSMGSHINIYVIILKTDWMTIFGHKVKRLCLMIGDDDCDKWETEKARERVRETCIERTGCVKTSLFSHFHFGRLVNVRMSESVIDRIVFDYSVVV